MCIHGVTELHPVHDVFLPLANVSIDSRLTVSLSETRQLRKMSERMNERINAYLWEFTIV